VDDHAAAQPHPIVARRHRSSAHEADRALVGMGRQDVTDLVQEGRHLLTQG
jgi:hypothetical protein